MTSRTKIPADVMMGLRVAWAGYVNLMPDEPGPVRRQMAKHANELRDLIDKYESEEQDDQCPLNKIQPTSAEG